MWAGTLTMTKKVKGNNVHSGGNKSSTYYSTNINQPHMVRTLWFGGGGGRLGGTTLLMIGGNLQ